MKYVITITLGVLSFAGLIMLIVTKAVKTAAVWMDDSFRCGGRDA